MSKKVKKPLTQKQRNKRIITVALIVTVVLIAASIVATMLYSSYRKDGGHIRSVVSFESDNYEVNNCMMTYFYFTDLYSTYENYGAYLPYMSPAQTTPDMTSSLSAQYYDYGTESGTAQSWHEYFINTTLSNVYGYLFYAEEAIENGFEYADLDSDIDEYIGKLTKDATSNELSLEKYIEKNYGSYVKEKDIRDALELQLYANAYMKQVQSNYKEALTEEEYNTYKEENIADLETVDYFFYTFGANVAEDATEEQKATATELAKAESDALLAAIEAAGDLDAKKAAFTDWVSAYITKNNENAAEPLTAEKLEEEIAAQTAENTDKKREDQLSFGKADNSDFGKWAYDEEHVAGDAAKFETGTGIYTVFLLTSPCGIDESATKNVCHILLTEDTYGSDEEAKAMAEKVLAEYRDGKAGKDAFEAVAEKYNEDGSSFYENVTEGAMAAEFNDWLFDAARVEGDTDVVKTTHGYHVMYFAGEGIPTWKAKAANDLIQSKIEAFGTELQEKYIDTISVDNNALLEIPDALPASAFTSEATEETTAVAHDHNGDGIADHTDEEHTEETTAVETQAVAHDHNGDGIADHTDEEHAEETSAE